MKIPTSHSFETTSQGPPSQLTFRLSLDLQLYNGTPEVVGNEVVVVIRVSVVLELIPVKEIRRIKFAHCYIFYTKIVYKFKI